jgi:tetratricopeptide (TPR) repeat protein
MGAVARVGVALLVTVALAAPARRASAGEAQRAVDEANAALTAEPPRRDAARGALTRATALGGEPPAVAEAYFRLGALDEEDEAFARAVADYRACLAVAPVSSGGRWARNASARMQWLSVRSEGGFAPLAQLQRLKQRLERAPALAGDAGAVEAFARDAEAFPPGIVRAESRLLVAAAWLGPLRRPRDAIRELRTASADRGADGMSLRLAERGLVDALLAEGLLDDAAQEVQGHAVQLDPLVVMRVQQLVRRRSLLRGAWIALATLATLIGLAVALHRRRNRGALAAPAGAQAGPAGAT